MLKKLLFVTAFAIGLGACSYVDDYERHVTDLEPVYCYKSLAATSCYRTPKHADALRLVNYFGPHPSRYDAPEPPRQPLLVAPEMVNYWVKDPEPLPRPMPHGDLVDRPWLTEEGRAEQRSIETMSKLQETTTGTYALLRRVAGHIELPPPSTQIE